MIGETLRPELHAYISGVAKALECPIIQIGGVADHVHILLVHSKNVALRELVEELKKRSSKWVNAEKKHDGKFYWQRGYGAFSVSSSRVSAVEQYILGQADHHKKVSFQDEFREFLKKYRVEYDERYVWD